MFKKNLIKPDGRNLYLYANHPIEEGIVATNPINDGAAPNPHMRWHPLRQEWVIYASHRQNRTFLPPKDYSPLKVTSDEKNPTEMPQGNYQVAVFENLFPSMNLVADAKPEMPVPTQPSQGVCEVVVFTQDPDGALGDLPLSQVKLVLDVLADRTIAMAMYEEIQYVMPFENRGVEMGVTLHHPHGQIYAYPFVPPVQQQILNSMEAFYQKEKKGLLAKMIEDEIRSGARVTFESEHAIAFIPVCARYPYETWVAPKRDVSYLHELSPVEMKDLALVLKTTLMKFDLLWERTFPYLMTLFQAPVDGKDYIYAHAYFQITPPYRTRDRLKYLAGTELGAGIFVNDSLPEEKARELQEIQVKVKDE
jgi:UDPglucose--hexose-1-phosphate uridylyltransferase